MPSRKWWTQAGFVAVGMFAMWKVQEKSRLALVEAAAVERRRREEADRQKAEADRQARAAEAQAQAARQNEEAQRNRADAAEQRLAAADTELKKKR